MSDTVERLLVEVEALRRRVARLETREIYRLRTATTNVGLGPTDAECDTSFGTPAEVGEGFAGLIDDNNAETAVYLCVAVGSSWWYETLTKAT